MRCEIVLNERLIGFASAAAGPGEKVPIVCSEFLSSEDGSRFISRLEGLQACLISRVPGCPSPSQIDNLLAVIRYDLHATVVVNELNRMVKAKPKRDMKAGQPVLVDDIADIVGVELDPTVPEDCGFVLIQSFGWRKSLFYDFAPLDLQPKRREYDLGAVLGFQYAYLLFQEQLQISDAQWVEMFKQSWFPFRFLPGETLKGVLDHAREGWDIDKLLDDDQLLAQLDTLADPASKLFATEPFTEHRDLISHALDRFRARDFKSVVALLYPRIEGVLRSVHTKNGIGKPTASALVTSCTASFEKARGEAILLMPSKFREYLEQIYFKKWNPGDVPDHVSRHTVSHGVAPEAQFNKKSAVLAILTILQLGLYF